MDYFELNTENINHLDFALNTENIELSFYKHNSRQKMHQFAENLSRIANGFAQKSLFFSLPD